MNSIRARVASPDGIRGRGSRSNVEHRYTERSLTPSTEWLNSQCAAGENPHGAGDVGTRVINVKARSILSRNTSPDIGFNVSLNPYQGCEHGCVYCFARPSHAWHELSPGLDFESVIMAKMNAVECLERELSLPGWRCETIAIGVNTDAYQPVERERRLTRRLLETCLAFRQPVALITKSALVLRDLDLLAEMAARNLVSVRVSVTTLDDELKRRLEPRTAGPAARLRVIEGLARVGVPVGAMVAPVIPRINDHEMEAIVAAVAERGGAAASYILLRLPHEVDPLFRDWLKVHYPDRSKAVMAALASCHGGRAYRPGFHSRMTGLGPYADIIAHRFDVARRRYGLARRLPGLDTSTFRADGGRQGKLAF
ncbi:PA0069 family radical SAM protein [Marinihelvus fidelis]|uniref:PA0069 family radical SAM protein n=1 Tax=Marinihelvus fidelis TaxID=2613842 RepID=A0A5N0TF21_9GAMM|nr:PA0069 family radical SAM protein [Marinihelvus fidelis]KAA9132717.1 PA0069 family radical SAM protein [Marinihelvus fidelis]